MLLRYDLTISPRFTYVIPCAAIWATLAIGMVDDKAKVLNDNKRHKFKWTKTPWLCLVRGVRLSRQPSFLFTMTADGTSHLTCYDSARRDAVWERNPEAKLKHWRNRQFQKEVNKIFTSLLPEPTCFPESREPTICAQLELVQDVIDEKKEQSQKDAHGKEEQARTPDRQPLLSETM